MKGLTLIAMLSIALAAVMLLGCVPSMPSSTPKDTQDATDGCGDGVCSAREANLGTCPADCQQRQEEPAPEAPEEKPGCVGEGGTIPVIANPPECCAGLTLIDRKESSILGISGICTAKCGNGACDAETESPKNCPADCVEKLNSQPICDGIGTSKEGWYQNDKLLFYNRCSIGNCVSECRNKGLPNEGWYNSCNNKQIKTGCGE